MAKTIEIDEGPELPDSKWVLERKAGAVTVRDFDGVELRELIDHLKAELAESRQNERQLRGQLLEAFGKLTELQTALPEFKFDFPDLPKSEVNFNERAFHIEPHTEVKAPIDARVMPGAVAIHEGAIKGGETIVNVPPAPDVVVQVDDDQ